MTNDVGLAEFPRSYLVLPGRKKKTILGSQQVNSGKNRETQLSQQSVVKFWLN